MGASMAPGNKAGSAEIADTTAKNRAITIYFTARRVRAKLAGRTKRRHLPFAPLTSPCRRNVLAIFFPPKVEGTSNALEVGAQLMVQTKRLAAKHPHTLSSYLIDCPASQTVISRLADQTSPGVIESNKAGSYAWRSTRYRSKPRAGVSP